MIVQVRKYDDFDEVHSDIILGVVTVSLYESVYYVHQESAMHVIKPDFMTNVYVIEDKRNWKLFHNITVYPSTYNGRTTEAINDIMLDAFGKLSSWQFRLNETIYNESVCHWTYGESILGNLVLHNAVDVGDGTTEYYLALCQQRAALDAFSGKWEA